MALLKVQMNLDENLMKQVDAYAELFHINRTAAVSVLLSRALQADSLADSLNQLIAIYNSEKSKLDIEKISSLNGEKTAE